MHALTTRHAVPLPALPAGHTVQIDAVDRSAWHAVLDRFDDASLYQSWSYESMRPGIGRPSRLVLCRDGEVIAAAQLRIVKLPLMRVGVAYARWGPMWRLRGQPAEPNVLALVLAAIRHEYAVRRGLSVRILPYLMSDEGALLHPVLDAGRFEPMSGHRPQRTLVMSLARPLAELRAMQEQKWRNGLNRAERNGLEIETGTGDELFARFIGIHHQMRHRKGFEAPSDIEAFRAIQRDLPERHRMRVFLASAQGVLAAGVVCSRIGSFGVFLHGATSDAGMPTQASSLLQWRAIEWLKAEGATTYNLHGINPDTNPGTHRFKAGLCGRAGRELNYLGTYEHCSAGASQRLVGLAEAIRRTTRQRRASLARPQDPAASTEAGR